MALWPGICNITLQDCGTRYPNFHPAPVDGSCVLDPRRGGLFGTCGWVGSRCSTVDGASNCEDASGLQPDAINLCHNGQCVGGVGDACSLDHHYDCLAQIDCNGTICGGDGAVFNSTLDDPIVPKAYCLSDATYVDLVHTTRCGPSPTATTSLPAGTASSSSTSSSAVHSAPNTSSTHKSTSTGPIVGGVVGGLVVVAVLIASLCLRRRRSQQTTERVNAEVHDGKLEESESQVNPADVVPVMERSIGSGGSEPTSPHSRTSSWLGSLIPAASSSGRPLPQAPPISASTTIPQDLQPNRWPNPAIPRYSPLPSELLVPTSKSPDILPAASDPLSVPESDVERRLIELQEQSLRTHEEALRAQDEAVRARDEAERMRHAAERTRLEAEQTLARYRARQSGEPAAGDVPPLYAYE